MSTHTESSIQQVIVTEKTLVKSFYDFDFDEDINGNNGVEFTSNEATKKGFESDLEFIIDKAEKKTAKLKGREKITSFARIVLDGLEEVTHYYEGSEFKVLDISNGRFVITFLRVTNS